MIGQRIIWVSRLFMSANKNVEQWILKLSTHLIHTEIMNVVSNCITEAQWIFKIPKMLINKNQAIKPRKLWLKIKILCTGTHDCNLLCKFMFSCLQSNWVKKKNNDYIASLLVLGFFLINQSWLLDFFPKYRYMYNKLHNDRLISSISLFIIPCITFLCFLWLILPTCMDTPPLACILPWPKMNKCVGDSSCSMG